MVTSPAIQLARECGDVETDRRGRETYTFDCYGVQRLMRKAQAKALRDAASKFRGEIGYNFVAADGYSNGFDVASELNFMSEELEKQA